MITVLMIKTIPTSNSITTAMLINCRSTRLMETRSSLARITRIVESKRAWQERKKTISASKLITVEPRYNEPLNNKDLGMTTDFLYPSNSKICEKEPRSIERNKFCQFLIIEVSL